MRLDLFDGIRGHLLIGMLVAHLSFQVGLEWLGNFHHFALIRLYDAEFFVLVAGLLIGWMSVNKLTTFEKRRKFIIGRIRTIYRR